MMEKRKTALVTGALGFIGRYVAKHLSQKGWYVIGIGHGEWQSIKMQKEWGVSEWINCSLSVESLRGISGPFNAIIHCAGSGSVGFSFQNPFLDFQRGVATTISVLEYARLISPNAQIITLSSAAVYGDTIETSIFESGPLHPISPYGVHKKISEDLCHSYSVNYELDISVLRLFSVYGDGLQKQLLWDACNKVKRGMYSFYGTGNELRDWVHVTDVASLVECVLENAGLGYNVFNGASGCAVSVSNVLKKLFENLNVPVKPIFTGEHKEGDPLGYVANIKKITELGWHPKVTLNQGIADYVEWFKRVV